MAMQFEYDDKGTTFYYFLLSFFAMILIPATYFLWPNKDDKKQKQKDDKPCYCPPCMEKREKLKQKEPKRKTLKTLTRATLVVLWALLIAGIVKVSQFEKDYSEYNPFDILLIDKEASQSEIKKQYRKLSLKYHPDRETGDPVMFMKIAKAYEALTDETARKNWMEYGNPDGPQATTFGIALPSWIVDKKNSMWVLAAYGFALLIILPVAVMQGYEIKSNLPKTRFSMAAFSLKGTWWYKSIQYSCDEVLMDTEQLYWYFLHRTPNMSIKRIIMILAASFEFEKGHNNDVQERPSDNLELPQLMRELPQLNEKNKERPLCFPYSVKARALIHAHLSRLDLPPDTLRTDLELILQKCPYLLKEILNVVSQLTALGKAGRVAIPPRLETLENIMKLHVMIVQAMWDAKSPFLMLPHITQDNLRHFSTKKRHIKTLKQFVAMKNDERRSLLRNFSDEQYQDVMRVCASYPCIDAEVVAKVLDEQDSHVITAGSIVTATVTLIRKSLMDYSEEEAVMDSSEIKEEEEEEVVTKDCPKPNKGWQKKQKKGKKAPPKKQVQSSKKKAKQQKQDKKKANGNENEEDKENKNPSNKNKMKKNKKSGKSEKEPDVDSGAAELNGDSDDEDNKADLPEDEQLSDSDVEDDDVEESEKEDVGIDDDEWDSLQSDIERPEAILNQKAKESHPVHAPLFPLEKQESWWVYIVARKNQSLITPPQTVLSLKDTEEVQLKFSVPDKPGVYHYQAVVRSDSYMDMDVFKNFKIEVSEAREVDPGAQWDFSSSEDEDKGDESGESVYETEEESD